MFHYKNKSDCASFSKELTLLALCAQNGLPPETISAIQTMATGEIDWARFLALAVKHRVYPVVFDNLSRNHMTLEVEVMKAIKECSLQSQTYSLHLTAVLLKVMARLQENGIKAISLKGPLLSQLIYHNPFLRPAKDLDILVGRKDLQKSEDCLAHQGFRKISESPITKGKHIRHLSFINREGVIIELHGQYSAGFCSISFEEMWGNRCDCCLLKQEFAILNQEDNLLYLIFHGSEHAWQRMRWLCDIHALILQQEYDWESVVKKARARRISHLLAQTLILLFQLFGYRTPCEKLKNMLCRKRAIRLASMAVHFLEYSEEAKDQSEDPLRQPYRRYMSVWNNQPFRRLKSVLRCFRTGLLRSRNFYRWEGKDCRS